MPPNRTSSLSDPSWSIAVVKRPVTCPCSVRPNIRRDRMKLRAVNTRAPTANSPAPSVSSWVRTVSRAACRCAARCTCGRLLWTSWLAIRSVKGPSSTKATKATATATTRPASNHVSALILSQFGDFVATLLDTRASAAVYPDHRQRASSRMTAPKGSLTETPATSSRSPFIAERRAAPIRRTLLPPGIGGPGFPSNRGDFGCGDHG